MNETMNAGDLLQKDPSSFFEQLSERLEQVGEDLQKPSDTDDFELPMKSDEPTRVLVIKPVNPDDTEESLSGLLSSFGEVLYFKLVTNWSSGIVSAVVVFANYDIATDAFICLQAKYQPNQVFFGKDVELHEVVCPDTEETLHRHRFELHVPEARLFLISPPASPPEHWKPRRENDINRQPWVDLEPQQVGAEQVFVPGSPKTRRQLSMPKIVVSPDPVASAASAASGAGAATAAAGGATTTTSPDGSAP